MRPSIICRTAGLSLILCIVLSIQLFAWAQQPHQRLGVRLDAQPAELRKAYRRKVSPKPTPLLSIPNAPARRFSKLRSAETRAPAPQRSPWSYTRTSTRPTRKPGPQGSILLASSRGSPVMLACASLCVADPMPAPRILNPAIPRSHREFVELGKAYEYLLASAVRRHQVRAARDRSLTAPCP